MLNKKMGYAFRRPFYTVDPNVEISAGMVAFLATNAAGATVATTAASGTVPIGCFWKDSALGYYRSTVETQTFNASDYLTLSKGNVRTATSIKVTDSTGATTYTLNTDYSISTTNGVVTRLGGGAISAAATVIIWYEYTVAASAIGYYGGTNYDRAPSDTLGSGKIAVVEGWAHIYTDQYDVTQAYTLNASLRSNASSQWSSASTGYPICGKVIQVPTVANPWLGVQQTTVLS